MRYRAIAIGLIFLACAAGSDAGQEAKKAPVPSKEAQATIETLITELWGKEFAKAEKDTAEKARLAQTLLFEGKDTKDNLAGRFVLFSKAHKLAAQAGDVHTALQAADELANDFIIPVRTIYQMKIEMLNQASKADNAPPDAYHSIIDRVTMMLEDTLDTDDYPASMELIAAAEQAAKKLRSIPLVNTMRKKQEEIARLQKEFARWAPFADMLAKTPNDAEANLEMGKYHALVKGNFERGLPMLARGGKGSLADLASADLSVQTPPLKLATSWLFYALKTKDASTKTHALLRSYHWYQESLNSADDKTRALIDSQLLDIAKMLPAEYRIGEITSEFKKVDIVSGPVYGCAFAPDGKRFVITGYDGALRVFNTKTGKEVSKLDGHAGKIWSVAFASDGTHAVSGGFDGTVRLWDVSTGRELKLFQGHKDYVRSVAISADGKWLLSGGDDRTLRLWNVSKGIEQRPFVGHDHTIWSVALSRDGTRALSASLDKTVRLWEAGTGSLLKKLEGHKDTVLCVAFTPDGRHAVSGSSDKTLRLWDLATGQTLQTFEGSAGYIHSVAVSPDGRRILSAGSDNTLRLWELSTGKEVRKLEGHRDQVWFAAFSRDGRLAISGGQDNSVRLWTGSR